MVLMIGGWGSGEGGGARTVVVECVRPHAGLLPEVILPAAVAAHSLAPGRVLAPLPFSIPLGCLSLVFRQRLASALVLVDFARRLSFFHDDGRAGGEGLRD
jgi:hypothetical protein